MSKVLIVDDDEANTYYLSTLLGAHGFAVETARHGAEALLKARKAPPDLIIADLLMPVMDGYTLLRHWRADQRLCSVPFIVHTATYTDPEDEQLAINLGADAFLLKPTEPDVLVARVHEVQARIGAAAAPQVGKAPVADESGLLREYSETLIRKLEVKTLQLEKTNQRLQQDIAAREAVEGALRESDERFRQLAENIDDIFWLSDLRGHIFYVSPAYQNISGFSPESLYAHPDGLLARVHPDDRERLHATLAGYTSGSWDQTYRIVCNDESVRYLRSRAYPVRNAAGQVYRMAGVSRDLTDYRLLEEQLRQSQKMEAIGRLAGGIAHDFNNLLTVILSYSSLVLRALPPEDDKIRGDVEEVRRAGERASELTSQLLAFSRQQMLRPRVLELGPVMRDMENMLARLLGEEIELTLLTKNCSSNVYLDPSQIEQIVMNLAINARDAIAGPGKITFELSEIELDAAYCASHAVAEPGRYVLLAATDTGEGMDAATRERIFEPFFTTKEQGKGTGLGLSTVFGIVKQSQGHIQVYSEPGIGTTFKIYFPCTGRSAETVVASRPTPATLNGSETILLVEDDDQVREVNCTILRRSGYVVLSARNGSEALSLHERFTSDIHLLLTDVIMPRMTGRELAQHLSQMRTDMKVLYVSGYTHEAIVHHGVLDAGIAFIEKPSTPDQLLRKVREVLDIAS